MRFIWGRREGQGRSELRVIELRARAGATLPPSPFRPGGRPAAPLPPGRGNFGVEAGGAFAAYGRRERRATRVVHSEARALLAAAGRMLASDFGVSSQRVAVCPAKEGLVSASVGRKLLSVLALGLALAACRDDPAGPCARGFACQVAGVDLFVERLEIVAAERDPETGLGIIEPSPVEIEFSVANRGDTISEPAILVLRYGSNPGYPGSPGSLAPDDSVQIPPLGPGERHEQRVVIESPEWAVRPQLAALTRGDRWHATAVLLVQDADTANNRAQSADVHVKIPVVDLSFSFEDTALWVSQPFKMHLTITNRSRHGALPASSVGFFLVEWDYVISTVAFGTHDVPAVAPESEYEEELLITISPAATWNDRVHQFLVMAVFMPAGRTDSTLYPPTEWWFWWYMTEPAQFVNVHPNYRACGAVPLVVGEFVAAPLVCTDPAPVYFFELAARTDRAYGIEQGGPPENWGASVYSAEGAHLRNIFPGERMVFSEPGTYFIGDFFPSSNPPPERFMRLIEEPLPSAPDARLVR